MFDWHSTNKEWEVSQWFIPHPWLITEVLTTVRWRVPLMEHELLTLPEHRSSFPVFGCVHVPRSLVFIAVICRSLIVICLLAIVSSISGFWLSLWYLQTLLLFVAISTVFHTSIWRMMYVMDAVCSKSVTCSYWCTNKYCFCSLQLCFRD